MFWFLSAWKFYLYYTIAKYMYNSMMYKKCKYFKKECFLEKEHGQTGLMQGWEGYLKHPICNKTKQNTISIQQNTIKLGMPVSNF